MKKEISPYQVRDCLERGIKVEALDNSVRTKDSGVWFEITTESYISFTHTYRAEEEDLEKKILNRDL